jgi:hypothetical protein
MSGVSDLQSRGSRFAGTVGPATKTVRKCGSSTSATEARVVSCKWRRVWLRVAMVADPYIGAVMPMVSIQASCTTGPGRLTGKSFRGGPYRRRFRRSHCHQLNTSTSDARLAESHQRACVRNPEVCYVMLRRPSIPLRIISATKNLGRGLFPTTPDSSLRSE